MTKHQQDKKKEIWLINFPKNHPLWTWIFGIIVGLLSFSVTFFLPHGVESLNDVGLNLGIKRFTIYNIQQWDNFPNQYYVNGNQTGIIYVGNKGDNALIPSIKVSLKPNNSEIIISCIEQSSQRDCFKGFQVEGNQAVTLQFNIQVGSPKEKNYELCVRVVDGRNSQNFADACKHITIQQVNIETGISSSVNTSSAPTNT